jgi:hypothetical protein
MKKRNLLFIVFALALFSMSFLVSAINDTSVNYDLAYSCLEDTIDEIGCSALSPEELIFSYLATGKCATEFEQTASTGSECWPHWDCTLKATSLAIMAMDKNSLSSEEAENWLFSSRETPSNLIWYLQIDNKEETSCEVIEDGGNSIFTIEEDKSISGLSGTSNCLSISSNGYWLEVDSSCYETDFEISCQDSDFLTSLLFTGQTPLGQPSPTTHVLENSSSASAGGTTIERIESFCFADISAGSCDYEGSLWATLVLKNEDYDISSFMPYLIEGAEENEDIFPEPILYMLTGFNEYKTNIASKQIASKYWNEYVDKYYDTALALVPFQYESFVQKQNAIDWLSEVQEEDGCWNANNVLSNAFLLYSVWPAGGVPQISPGGGSSNSCSDNGYFCMSSANCEGSILNEYDCFGSFYSCCDTEQPEVICSEIGGEICSSNEYCGGAGEVESTSDTTSYTTCCVGGTCQPTNIPDDVNQCESNMGVCEPGSCGSGYEEDFTLECEYLSDTCCMYEAKEETGVPWWIWILGILILLVVAGILFKDNIKLFFLKMKGGGNSGASSGRPAKGMPPSYPRNVNTRPPMQRRVVPQQRAPQRRMPPQRRPKELDDVLTKLKEMSK